MPPEQWRPVNSHPTYEVSDHGRVRNTRTGRHLTGGITSRGYRKINLPGRQRYVHQLVLEAFIGPRPAGHDVDHLDWNRLNNTLGNLRWLRSVENAVRWQARDERGRNVWSTPDDVPDEELLTDRPATDDGDLEEWLAAWAQDRSAGLALTGAGAVA